MRFDNEFPDNDVIDLVADPGKERPQASQPSWSIARPLLALPLLMAIVGFQLWALGSTIGKPPGDITTSTATTPPAQPLESSEDASKGDTVAVRTAARTPNSPPSPSGAGSKRSADTPPASAWVLTRSNHGAQSTNPTDKSDQREASAVNPSEPLAPPGHASEREGAAPSTIPVSRAEPTAAHIPTVKTPPHRTISEILDILRPLQ